MLRKLQIIADPPWTSRPFLCTPRCTSPAVETCRDTFRCESRFPAESGCIDRMHSTIKSRFDVHTATRFSHIRPHALLFHSRMSTAAKPSALTMELKGKCSVCHYHLRNRLRDIDKFMADEQSQSFGFTPSSWPSRIAHVHARGDSGIAQGPHARAAGGDRMQTMSEQHLSPRVEAGSGSPRCYRGSPQASRLELQYSD